MTDPSSTSPPLPVRLEPTRNIVVVGETGVGKSSLINLVTGVESARIGNDVRGVTIGTEYHDWVFDGQTFHLWDTPGLNEGTYGSVSPREAQDALRLLLAELSKAGGVHLMILCMRGLPRVTKNIKVTYDTIVKIRDKTVPEVPLVAVITELEKRSTSINTVISDMEGWWMDNFQRLSDFSMQFPAHACITILPDDHYPTLYGRRDLCQAVVRRLIIRAVSLARNIVIVGQAGAGKSSLVNLVLGSEQAITAGITATVTQYDSEIDGQLIRLWDTSGLGEGLRGSRFQKRAQEVLRSLFSGLNERGGVCLLIICVREVSETTIAPILKICEKLCPETPVVAAITGLEDLSNAFAPTLFMEEWWEINSGALADCKEMLSGHACITTLPDSHHPQMPGRRIACQKLVHELIMEKSLRPQTGLPKDLHILLFGETGVGKSSIINLLAGRSIAAVSPDSAPCTLDSSEYQFQLDYTTIRLWDTVGLEEPERRSINYVGAVEKATKLIRRLNASGGISLFLFCMRGNRITAFTLSNYRLFYEILGKREVPVALVVTHLEREADMEDWWDRNGKILEKNNEILWVGHACITSLEGHPKCVESRDVLQRLLSRFDDQGKFMMPPEAWVGRIMKGLESIIESVSGKDLVDVLMKRCYLDPDIAQRVAACIDSDSLSDAPPHHIGIEAIQSSRANKEGSTASVGALDGIIHTSGVVLELWRKDKLLNAIELLSEEMASTDKREHVLANRAVLRARLHQWGPAVRDARKSILIKPTILAHVAISMALIGQGKTERAKKQFNKLFRRCDVKDVVDDISFIYLIKAIIMFTSGNHEEGTGRLTNLILLHPEADAALYRVVQAHMYAISGKAYIDKGQYDMVLKMHERLLGRALPRFPNHPQFECISLIFGWTHDSDDLRFRLYQQQCEALYALQHREDVEILLQIMLKDLEWQLETKNERRKWLRDFVRRYEASIGDKAGSSDAVSPAV